ncbi:organic cation transporter protein-like [Babylonia areolata]|uniref:organic cation transporter protein-like n=1 Tax=Babylonia areolata TaxID=304850 RepID=UPI003FCF44A8
MKFDEVLSDVGEFGTYQKRIIFLICITSGCVHLQNLSPVFTMVIPHHRCQIPGLPNDTYEVQSAHHAWLINLTIPLTDEEGHYSQCTVYDVASQGADSSTNKTERTCQQWVFDRSVFKETLTSQLNLVCGQKIYRSHTSMMIFAGKFVGAFLTSMFGDRFGRRRVYTVTLLIMLSSAVAIVFVTSVPVLMALRFLAGGSTTGSYLCTYVIGMELMGKTYRRFVPILVEVSQVVVTMLAILAAFLLRHWSPFQACIAAPCFFCLVGFFFIPESPRWLISKGRLNEAQKIIEKIARANGAASPVQLETIMADVCEEVPSSSASANPVQLFRVPRLLVCFSLLYLSWILIIMNLYGLMLNISTMSGNVFLNFFMYECMGILALVLFSLFVERVGRRPLMASCSALAGVACLATILPTVLGGDPWILNALSMIGRLGTSTAMLVLYFMSLEIFPTVVGASGSAAAP